jgi:oxaloacetate decarboxylase beta subunit
MSIENWVMFAISALLVYLAIKKGYEPLLLIPISFGVVLANFPLADMSSYGKGIIGLIYRTGVETELLPPIIFLGIGVLTDFRPLLSRPFTFLLGAAAQLGVFIAALGSVYLFGFTQSEY